MGGGGGGAGGWDSRVGGCFSVTSCLLPFQDLLESWIAAPDSSFLTEVNVHVPLGMMVPITAYLMICHSLLRTLCLLWMCWGQQCVSWSLSTAPASSRGTVPPGVWGQRNSISE